MTVPGSRQMRGQPGPELPDEVDSVHELYPLVPDHSGGTSKHLRQRECFNCFTTTPTKWQRSKLPSSAGELLCYKCSLFERRLGHPRPRPPVPLDTTSTAKEQLSADLPPPAQLIHIEIVPHSNSLPPPDWDGLFRGLLQPKECARSDTIEDGSREEITHVTARNFEEPWRNYDPSTAKQDGVDINHGECMDMKDASRPFIIVDAKRECIPERTTHMPSYQDPPQRHFQYLKAREEVQVARATAQDGESCANFDSTAEEHGVDIAEEGDLAGIRAMQSSSSFDSHGFHNPESLSPEEGSHRSRAADSKRECMLQNIPVHITQMPSSQDTSQTPYIEGYRKSPSPSPETIDGTWEEVAYPTAHNKDLCCKFDPGTPKTADEEFMTPEGSSLPDTEDLSNLKHTAQIPSSQDTLQTRHPRQIVDQTSEQVGNSEDIPRPYSTTSEDPLPLQSAYPELEIVISKEAEKPARGVAGLVHSPEFMDNDFDLSDATSGTCSWLDRISSILPSGRFHFSEESQPRSPGWPGEHPVWPFQRVQQFDLESEAIPSRRHLTIKKQPEGYHPKLFKDPGPPFGDPRFLDTRRKRSISCIHAHVWWNLELGRGSYTCAIRIKDSVIIMRDQHGTTNTGNHNRTDNGNRYGGSGPQSDPTPSTPGSRLLLTQQQKRSALDFATFTILTIIVVVIVSAALVRPDLTSTRCQLAPPEPPPLARAHFMSTFKATVHFMVLDASGSSVLASTINQLIDIAILLTIVVPLLMYITFWLRKLFGVLQWASD